MDLKSLEPTKIGPLIWMALETLSKLEKMFKKFFKKHLQKNYTKIKAQRKF